MYFTRFEVKIIWHFFERKSKWIIYLYFKFSKCVLSIYFFEILYIVKTYCQYPANSLLFINIQSVDEQGRYIVKQKPAGYVPFRLYYPNFIKYKLINNKLLPVQFSIFIISISSKSSKKHSTQKYGLERNGCLEEKV